VFRREQPDLPVLMITGDPRTETRAQALRAGVVAALEKLCDAEVLLAAVAGALRPTDPRGATGHYNVGEHNEP
jgi:DNA-binding response OmpR family regulator